MIRPLVGFCCSLAALAGAAEPPAFVAEGNVFRFDTGALRGLLRGEGKARGLLPVVDCATGANLARSVGLFSHYRLLDASTRYGVAGWEWASKAELLPDGAVVARWTSDAVHPALESGCSRAMSAAMRPISARA